MTSRWLFKRKADGRCKVRLVVRGFQEPGLDGTEDTYSLKDVALSYPVGSDEAIHHAQFDVQFGNGLESPDLELSNHFVLLWRLFKRQRAAVAVLKSSCIVSQSCTCLFKLDSQNFHGEV
jgi:hypothetical protein